VLAKLLTLPTSAFALALALALATGATSADWHTDIGWDDFKAELGGGYPDGTNVLVVQSEAAGSGAAGLQDIPNPASAQMTGKTITPQVAGGNSSHALSAARNLLLGWGAWGRC
jgi:hypothetical protein